MSVARVYLNGNLTTLKLLSFELTESIKDYTSTLELKFLNPKGQNNDAVHINDKVKLELYDKSSATWVKRFEGYVSKVDADPQKHELKVEALSWNGRLQERYLNEVYEHEELSQIVRDFSSKLLSEFTQDYIQQTGTEVTLSSVVASDGTRTLSTAGNAIAQRFTANEIGNLFKVKFYITVSNAAVVDVELRTNNSGEPGDLLKIKSNVELAAGWNTIVLTRKGLTNGTDYWVVLRLKSGDFTIAVNGSGSSGRVKTWNGSTWSTDTADDLEHEFYAIQDGTILEYYKAVEKPLDRVFRELADMVSWIFYIDMDGAIHFHPENFTDSGLTLDKFIKVDEGLEGKRIYNRVKVYGGNDIRQGSEDFKGDGVKKSFYLSLGKVVKDSVQVSGISTAYTVNYETNTVIFDTAPANGTTFTVSYSYFVPVIAVASDDVSIAEIGVRELVKTDENIRTLSRANEVAKALLDLYRNPKKFYRVTTKVYPTLKAGEMVTLNSPLLGVNDSYVVVKEKIRFGAKGYRMELNLAAHEIMTVPEVLKELKEMLIETRIKQTESTRKTTDLKNFYDSLFMQDSLVKQERAINDSAIYNHPTNGVFNTSRYGDRRGSWTIIP